MNFEATCTRYSSMDVKLLTNYPRSIHLNGKQIEILGEGSLGTSAFLYTENFAITHTSHICRRTCRLIDIKTSSKNPDTIPPAKNSPKQRIKYFFENNDSSHSVTLNCDLTFEALYEKSTTVKKDIEVKLLSLDASQLLSASLVGALEPPGKLLQSKSKAVKRISDTILELVLPHVIDPCHPWIKEEMSDLWAEGKAGYVLSNSILILFFDKQEVEFIDAPFRCMTVKCLVKHAGENDLWTVQFHDSKKNAPQPSYVAKFQELKTPSSIQLQYDIEMETRRRIQTANKGKTKPGHYAKPLERDILFIKCYNDVKDSSEMRWVKSRDLFKQRHPKLKVPAKSTIYAIVKKAKEQPHIYGKVEE
jgi:hypothetical protein